MIPQPMSREGLPPGAIGVIVGEPDSERRERLRKAYAEIPIPPVLQVRLEGTPAQIEAVREYEQNLVAVVDSDEIDDKGRAVLPEWEVTLRASCSTTVIVNAASKEHAERLVEADNFDGGGMWEPDYDDYEIDEIRKVVR